MRGRVGCAEAMEREVFFVTFVLSFVNMIVLCGREGGTCMEEGDMRGRAEACMEENGPMSRSMEGWEEGSGRLRQCFYLFSCLPPVC